MNKSIDIWDLIVNKGINNYADQLKPRTTTVVIIGSPKAGKTTLIHSFLDNAEEPKASLPIEYTYARRTNKHMIKDVCYLWEIQTTNINFIDLLIENEKPDTISILVVLDMSDPRHLFKICETVAQFHQQKSSESKVLTFGFIGTKHDMFEEMETEKKSIINQIIQYHVKAVQGIFTIYNKGDRSTVKKVKDLFSSLAFNTKLSNQLKNEAIDSDERPYTSPKNNSEIEFLTQLFRTKFGQQEDKSPEDEDTTEDANFANQAIDLRRSNK